MRIMSRAWRLAVTVAAGLIITDGALLAGDAPVVHVTAAVGQQAVRLEAQANGPFQYTSYRASKSLYVLDLSGVSAADGGAARVIPSELVKGYREVGYSVGDKPMVRLEVLLAEGLQPRVKRTNADELSLSVSRSDDAASPATAAPVLKPASAVSSTAKVETVPAPSIRQVLLSQKGNATEVSIVGSGSLTYHTMSLHSPDRLVLDFQSARLRTSVKHIPSNLDPVRDVRVAQFTPEISRVVIDLRQAASYTITKNAGDVTVAFSPEPAKPLPAEIPANVSVAKAIAPKQAPVSPQVSTPLPMSATLLPATLVHDSLMLADPIPVPAKPHEQPAATATKVAAAPVAGSTAAPVAAPSHPAATAARSADYSGPGNQSNPRYTGEPISVNLKNVDLQDFFRLIHEISGLNVVVDPNVKGTLTIVLDNVPWDQALDIVLHNNDLEKQLDGNVLRIATRETIKKEAEEQRDLSKAQAEAAEVVTTTRVLSYAKAADMATMLKKFLSARGQILADDRSNTLVISDVPAVFPVIDNLIRQLDRKSRQVEIEARVVAANRSFAREFGTQLAAALGAGNSTLGGALSASPITHSPAPPFCESGTCTPGTPPSSTSPGTPSSGAMPLITNLGTAVPTSGFSYIFQNGNFALDEIITAAEDRGVGKLLSKPTIFTQNNEKGVVKQGTKIPVQTIVNNTVSVQFVDAVLELDVTPQITADGTIYMDVTIENDQIDQAIPRVEGIPAIDTQSAQTRVTVKDGATVVVGGIMVSTQRTDVQDVPVLGSVPIIGNLFKHKTVATSEQELLFFLTPRILPG
ncbi:MAG TPA: type IV pilus secretin PilQ [Candidatus Acidoferrales bacterium]|nr:type IV pilus secretin PilQ [Candidatus Acidoferrales bacterium]